MIHYEYRLSNLNVVVYFPHMYHICLCRFGTEIIQTDLYPSKHRIKVFCVISCLLVSLWLIMNIEYWIVMMWCTSTHLYTIFAYVGLVLKSYQDFSTPLLLFCIKPSSKFIIIGIKKIHFRHWLYYPRVEYFFSSLNLWPASKYTITTISNQLYVWKLTKILFINP